MNKKIILTFTAIILFLGSSYSQTSTDTRETIVFGIKAGLNLSNVYDEQGDNFNADSKFGFVTGGFLSVPLGKLIGIQPEFLFSQKGFQAKGSFLLGGDYSYTKTTNFIDVPIFFNLKPTKELSLLIGPQYSYLLKETNTYSNGVSTSAQEKEFENSNIRKNLLSFALGADVNLNHMALGLRACWDVQNNKGDGTSTVPRYKNVWYQATIAYRIF